MKSIRAILASIFILGICIGMVRWFVIYIGYSDTEAFRNASYAQKRIVLAWLIRERPLADVRAYLRVIYPQEAPDAHSVGHLLGEESYRMYGDKAFSLCDTIFNYGCYHGVVDIAVRMKGSDTHIVEDLKRACDQTMSDAAPCIHPLGHVSVIVMNYNLIRALELCDRLYPEPKVAFSCWNGVMMEYINRSASNAPRVAYGDPNDIYAPCNTIPIKYEASCVSGHVTYLASVWGDDFKRLFTYCQFYRDGDTKDACIDVLGSHFGQQFFSNAQQILPACAYAGVDSLICIQGAMQVFSTAHQYAQAKMLCDSLDKASDKTICYERMNRKQ